jgi:CRISPR-associated DxTHG motif protein
MGMFNTSKLEEENRQLRQNLEVSKRNYQILEEKTNSLEKKVRKQPKQISDVKTEFLDIKDGEKKRVIISFLGVNRTDKLFKYTSWVENFRINGEYHSMYPLFAKEFFKDSKLILVGNEKAVDTQRDIGRYYQLPKSSFDHIELIENENDYKSVFQLLNTIIQRESKEFGKIIVDLTHGYRHIPILAMISIITQNLNYRSVKNILFAKQQKDEFEIIDLIEYIDIANINYSLQSFRVSYSLLEVPKVQKSYYQELLNQIHNFSKIMVGNLFGELFKKDSITSKLIQSIDDVLQEDETFKELLSEIRSHIKIVEDIHKKESLLEQHLLLADVFRTRKFYLNSIILLNEATGHLYSDFIRKLEIPDVLSKIEEKRFDDNFTYNIAQSSREVFRVLALKEDVSEDNQQSVNRTNFLNSNPLAKNIREELLKRMSQEDINMLSRFTQRLRDIRNGLSHGNYNSLTHDIDTEIEELFEAFGEVQKIKIVKREESYKENPKEKQ